MRSPGASAAALLRRLAPAVTGLVVAGLVLSFASTAIAASSSQSGTSPGFSRPKPTPAQKKAEAAFQKCLSEHGVKLPSHPTGGGNAAPGGSPGSRFPHGSFAGGSGSSKLSKAFGACAKLAPKGFANGFRGGSGGSGGSFKPSAAQQQALTTYEQCMSSHGVQIAAGSTFETIRSLIKEDSAAATANKACEPDLKGAFTPPGSSGTTTSPPG